MNTSGSRRRIAQSVNIAAGTLFFFIALLLFYCRQLGPAKPSVALFVFVAGIGVCTAIIGAVEANGHPPGDRGFGATLAVQGVVLIVLTMIAWVFGAPIPLPPLE